MTVLVLVFSCLLTRAMSSQIIPSCYLVDKTWINSTLIDFQAPVFDYEECRVLCRDTTGCDGWTWSSENNTAIRNNCLLYSDLGQDYFPFPDSIRKLQFYILSSLKLIPEERECRDYFASDADCGFYTWYDGSHPVLGNTCLLLSSCSERDTSCSSCHSAPEPCSLHLPVDGEWSPWTAWSSCPSDLQCCGSGCDAGTQRRERTCSQPQYGGRDCQGEREQSRDCFPPSCPASTIIEPPWTHDWGSWGSWSKCPAGHYVLAVKVKVENYQGAFYDDSALNGIRLKCSNGLELSSREGPDGQWSSWTSSSLGLTAGDMRSEPRDSWAAAAIKFRDCQGSQVTPGYQFDSDWGNYMGWAYCPLNTLITGLKSKADSDDTGLNRVQFECKYVDHPDIKSCYHFDN